MRLHCIEIKAKDCPCDVFVFIPTANMFYFVDDIEVTNKKTKLYFEPSADPDSWTQIELPNNKKILVVNNYNVNPENFY